MIGLTRQAQRSQEKRQHIYQVAMGLFLEHGYSRISVRDICRAAEITNGTFYHFFEEKHDILVEYYHERIQLVNALLEPTPEHLAAPFPSVYRFCLATADVFDDCGKELMREILHTPKRDNRKTQISIQTAIALVHDFLTQAKAAGTIPPDYDTQQAAEHILIMNNGMFQYWVTMDTPETLHQLTQRILSQAFRAYTEGLTLEPPQE